MKGAHVTLGRGQVRETIGVPGTGLTYTHVERTHRKTAADVPGAEQAPAAPQVPLERRPLSLGRALAALVAMLAMVAIAADLVRQLW